MKIIQILTGVGSAGAEQIVLELTSGLVDLNHDVGVVSLMPFPERSVILDKLEATGIPVFTLNLRKSAPWRLGRLRLLLDRFSPDLVHAHMFHANIASRFAGISRGFKIVNTVHKVEVRPTRRWELYLDRMTLKMCDCQTAVSNAIQQYHSARMGIHAECMPVIKNGIATIQPLTNKEIQALRASWGVNDCHFLMGSVGRMVEEKGYDILLRILPELGARIPTGEKWGLVILGDGPMESTLRSLADRASPRMVVVLPGFREDARRCIGAFDLFVMPSRSEGFGLSLAEAMAHGIPVLVSDLVSLHEVADGYPGATFLDFSEEHTAEIASTVVRLADHRLDRNPMHPFTVDQMIAGYVDLYLKLTGKKEKI